MQWCQIMRKTGTPGNQNNGAAGTRCAIFARKSSEEGLEQEINSLDAQREACEAYILSQKSIGWKALPDMSGTNAFRSISTSNQRY